MAQARRRRTQEERSAETRRVLLQATISALHEHGYGATTTMLVAERAKVSRGAMLHQFRTKADLMTFVVSAVYEDEVGRYKKLLRSRIDPKERLLAYPEAVWKVLSRPSGVAVLEILQGSRSDAQLAKQLKPLQAKIEADARAKVSEELGGSTSLELMRLIVWAVRGLSVAKVLATDPGRVAGSVALLQQLMRVGLESGVLKISPKSSADASGKKKRLQSPKSRS